MSDQYNPDYPTSGRMLTRAERDAPREPLNLHADCIRRDDPVLVALRDALEWYGENARLCRLIHSEGDIGRHALSADGGNRARVALAARMEGRL